MSRPARGVLDTSVFIAQESGRALDDSKLPEETTITVITLAELEAGVLAASDVEARARRLETLDRVRRVTPLPTDERAAHLWAFLRAHLAEKKRRVNVNDLWIAATAVANMLPLVTQDDDFDPIDGVAGLKIIRV